MGMAPDRPAEFRAGRVPLPRGVGPRRHRHRPLPPAAPGPEGEQASRPPEPTPPCLTVTRREWDGLRSRRLRRSRAHAVRPYAPRPQDSLPGGSTHTIRKRTGKSLLRGLRPVRGRLPDRDLDGPPAPRRGLRQHLGPGEGRPRRRPAQPPGTALRQARRPRLQLRHPVRRPLPRRGSAAPLVPADPPATHDLGGIEIGSGISINPSTPESDAAFLNED